MAKYNFKSLLVDDNWRRLIGEAAGLARMTIGNFLVESTRAVALAMVSGHRPVQDIDLAPRIGSALTGEPKLAVEQMTQGLSQKLIERGKGRLPKREGGRMAT